MRNSTQAKLPWMDVDAVDAIGSVCQRSPSPYSNDSGERGQGQVQQKAKNSTVLPQWIEKSKNDPLRSSLDDMLEALDKWEPTSQRYIVNSYLSVCSM